MPCCKDYTCNPVSCLFLTQNSPVKIFLSFQFVFLRLSILVSGQRFVLLSENVVCFFFLFLPPPGWSGLQTCCQQQRRWGWSVFSFLLSAADWAVCRIFSSVCCRKCPPLLILCKKCVYWVWGQCFLEIALGIFYFFFFKERKKILKENIPNALQKGWWNWWELWLAVRHWSYLESQHCHSFSIWDISWMDQFHRTLSAAVKYKIPALPALCFSHFVSHLFTLSVFLWLVPLHFDENPDVSIIWGIITV